MSNFQNWEDIRKDFNFSSEEEAEMQLEMEIIEATIRARKEAGMTQKELSEKSGIVQSSIAKIETFKRSPQASTLVKLLVPLGYTLKVVPLNEAKEN